MKRGWKIIFDFSGYRVYPLFGWQAKGFDKKAKKVPYRGIVAPVQLDLF
ncbi:MAG: hypothetical protein AB7O48_16730 [Cyclobacteriaceae bacterium]